MSRDLPKSIREHVSSFPEWRMRAHRVTVSLADGRRVSGVVAWGREIVRVDGSEDVPFEGEEVVAVAPDLTP